MAGDIGGTYKEKIYSELDLESLQDIRWHSKLCIFNNILNLMSPQYFSDIIPGTTIRYASRYAKNIPLARVKNNIVINNYEHFFTVCNNLSRMNLT